MYERTLYGSLSYAVVAQLVEHLIGNEEVSSSSLPNSFLEKKVLDCVPSFFLTLLKNLHKNFTLHFLDLVILYNYPKQPI